ncbi:MAG: sugar phosphate isomerase/epimerase [Bryobacterales bacterium]|jgi:sugar phosphate isomerase/epimerase|nr:sugar phosphate isomerase/epimerase [Bryobacterales bacterium]
MNRRTLLGGLPLLAAAAPLVAGTRSQDMFGNKARLKPAICAYSYRKELAAKTLTYSDLVRIAVDHDVDGLDLTVYWFPSTEDTFLMPLRRLAYVNGVEIYSISVRTNLCQPEAGKRQEQVLEIMKWVDVAAKLGAGHIRVFGGNVPKGHTEDEAAGWCVDVLRRASDYAGKHGVILGLENHGGITDYAERIVEIVSKVNSDYVGINLDTGNFKQRPVQQIQMCMPYAVAAQYKTKMAAEDSTQRVASDWDKLTGMFAASGYKGYLAVEYEDTEPTETAMPRLLAELRRLCLKHTGSRA